MRPACGKVVPQCVPPAGRRSRDASCLRAGGPAGCDIRNSLQANVVSAAGGKMLPSTMVPARARQFARRARLSIEHDVHGPFSCGDAQNDDFSI